MELTERGVVTHSSSGVDLRIPPGGLDIEEVEKELIRQSLEMTNGNQTRSAKLLNLTRDTLRYRMQKFGFLPEKD
jgi:two-component system response regulator AtoC